MNFLRLSLAAMLVLLLGACGSTSPDVRFYTLRSTPVNIGSHTEAKVIGLGPIAFPDYLKRPQIVTRKSGNQLDIAEYDRWAEPVERAFARILASNVDDMLDGTVVVMFPYNAMVEVDFRVVGRVFRFDTDENGTAILEVQWGAGDKDGNNLIPARRTYYEVRVAKPGDYDSIARALNKTVDAFSADIAAVLSPFL